MKIIVRLDVVLAQRKMKSKDLAAKVGISEQNLSMLKSGKVKGVRFETLAKICQALKCQPGDILEFESSAGDPLAAKPDLLKSMFEGVRKGDGS